MGEINHKISVRKDKSFVVMRPLPFLVGGFISSNELLSVLSNNTPVLPISDFEPLPPIIITHLIVVSVENKNNAGFTSTIFFNSGNYE